jgi:hypothetical protein
MLKKKMAPQEEAKSEIIIEIPNQKLSSSKYSISKPKKTLFFKKGASKSLELPYLRNSSNLSIEPEKE